jgi:hypothetical protein
MTDGAHRLDDGPASRSGRVLARAGWRMLVVMTTVELSMKSVSFPVALIVFSSSPVF